MPQNYFVPSTGNKSNPFIIALIGIVVFLGSFVVVYKNEGRINLAAFAKKAIPLVEGETYADGQLVAITGPVVTDEVIGDSLFKKPERYISLRREVQMYAWDESSQDKDNGKEYIYQEEWTSFPEDSSNFQIKTGHENPKLPFKSETFSAVNLKIGNVVFSGTGLSLPDHRDTIALTKTNVDLLSKYGKSSINSDGSEIYVTKKTTQSQPDSATGTEPTPEIGDLRISYKSIPVESQVTVFGAYKATSPQSIEPYTAQQSLKDSETFYHMRYGNQADATEALGEEFTFMLWALRISGFIAMLIGFNMILSPIKALLGYIPIVGQIGNFALAAISFVVVVVLYTVTLLIAIVAHNPVALVVTAISIIIIAAFITKKFVARKELVSNQIVPPIQSE
jgi:hypothetical protein